MTRTVLVIQASMCSRRLPGKAMRLIAGQPMLGRVVERCRQVKNVHVILAITNDPRDDCLVHWTPSVVPVYRSPPKDLLGQFATIAQAEQADRLVRITADCPLIDPVVIQWTIDEQARVGGLVATRHDHIASAWPDGLDVEVFPAWALHAAVEGHATEREHFTSWMHFESWASCLPWPGPELHGRAAKWSVDTEEDVAFVEAIYRGIGHDLFSWREVVAWLALESARAEFSMTYAIGGTQTLSKRRYPANAPRFAVRGQGCYLWGENGKRYVDHVAAMGPVILGYDYSAVQNAIRAQLERGISFSLPTELEEEVAAELCRLIPCAEAVRFTKNGADAVNAAVKLARAWTGRDHIATGGSYHGHDDWFIGAHGTMRAGVPASYAALTHPFAFSDLDQLEGILKRGDVAAIVTEPIPSDRTMPAPTGHYEALRRLADEYEALLVFDEMVTGFRTHWGGYQAVCGVTPDLACFGKALANGMPLACVVGKRAIMERLTHDVFVSTTFGGETLSLAAAKATLRVLVQEDVPARLAAVGTRLMEVYQMVTRSLDGLVCVGGYPARPFLHFSDEVLRERFTSAMIDQGHLWQGYHNVMLALADDPAALSETVAAIHAASEQVARKVEAA